ncbi:MAG: hypothetical protein U9N86_13560 [Bacteroidota bacterium]|nr:hypothetical protein [Bacteroidota bacterium]
MSWHDFISIVDYYRMGRNAVLLGNSMHYYSMGTVEFRNVALLLVVQEMPLEVLVQVLLLEPEELVVGRQVLVRGVQEVPLVVSVQEYELVRVEVQAIKVFEQLVRLQVAQEGVMLPQDTKHARHTKEPSVLKNEGMISYYNV